MKNKITKSLINFILIILIMLIVFYFALKDNYKSILIYLNTFNLLWLSFSILLINLYWLFKSLSLYETTKLVQKKIKLWECFKIIVITEFFNGVTPFASGGQPAQIYLISKEKINLSAATNISLQNFILYQIPLIILGLIALIYNGIFNIFENAKLLQKFIILGFLFNLLTLLILFVLSFGKKINKIIINFWIKLLLNLKLIKKEEDNRNKIDTILKNFYESASLLKENKKIFIKGIIYNFLGLIALYLIPLIIFYGFNDYNSLRFDLSIVTTAYVMIIGSCIPIAGGSGGLEYAFTNLFLNFQNNIFVSSSMIVWRFVTYYFALIIGGIALFIYKKGEKK